MPYKMKNGKYRATRMINGKKRSAVFTTLKEAKKWEQEQTEDLWESQELQTHSKSLFEILNIYLSSCVERFSSSCNREKQGTFRVLFKYLAPDIKPNDFTPALAREILSKIAQDYNKEKANRVLKQGKSFWNWGRVFYSFGDNPFNTVKKFPVDEIPVYVPPIEDFWKVYDIATEHDKPFLLFLLHTAARKNEAFKLTWNDVNLDNQTVRLGTRKTSHGGMTYSWIPLTSKLYEELKKLKEKGASSDYVFVSERTGKPFKNRCGYMEEICPKAQVKYFGFHAIRHLTATILAHEGLDIPTIQGILRHSNIGTTARYIAKLGIVPKKLEAAMSSQYASCLDFQRAV